MIPPRYNKAQDADRLVAGLTNTGAYVIRRLPPDKSWKDITVDDFPECGVHIATLDEGTLFLLVTIADHVHAQKLPRLMWITSPIARADKELFKSVAAEQCIGEVAAPKHDPYPIQKR